MDIKRFIVFSYTIFLSLYCFAQDQEVDSLKAVIENLHDDSIKVIALNDLSLTLWDTQPDLAIQYGFEARDLGDKINYKRGVAYALKYIGMGYYTQGDYIGVLEYFRQSLSTFESLGDQVGISNLLNNLGNVYITQGDDAKAIDYYLRSLQVAEEIGDTFRIASAFLNIGNVYINKSETHDKALDYLLQGLKLSEELGKHDAIGNASVNIGEIYYLRNSYDSALFYFEKSLKASEIEGGGNVPYSLNNIGKVYSRTAEYSLAINHHEQAYKISEEINDKLQMTQSLIGLGNTYKLSKNFKKALKSYNEAESIAKNIGTLNELQEIYEGLATVYAGTHNYTNAFSYQTLLTEINYELYNAENDKKLERLQFSYDLDKKQGEVDLLTKDKALQELDIKRQRLAINAAIIGLVLIFIIAIIIYRNYRHKVKTNRLLDEQNEEIENLLLNILPVETAKELQKDGYATPRYYDSASVLFTDFKGFTRIAGSLKPHELIAELNSFFNAFDDIIEQHHLEKIKTIGDAYMCAGGIPVSNDTHPIRIVKAGLAIQEYMQEKNKQRVKQGMQAWELRVGIHTGPIVAGVVGKKKYAYDIWGDTVNIASRMESNGEVGKVNISHATFELVKDHFECKYRGKIEAKNKGFIDMYFLESEKEANFVIR